MSIQRQSDVIWCERTITKRDQGWESFQFSSSTPANSNYNISQIGAQTEELSVTCDRLFQLILDQPLSTNQVHVPESTITAEPLVPVLTTNNMGRWAFQSFYNRVSCPKILL